jgi:hypothetical protein
MSDASKAFAEIKYSNNTAKKIPEILEVFFPLIKIG